MASVCGTFLGTALGHLAEAQAQGVELGPDGLAAGELLDSEAAVLGYAGRMTYNGVHPQVQRCRGQYPKGVKLTKPQKKCLEEWLQRKAGLEKWAIEIAPPAPDQTII